MILFWRRSSLFVVGLTAAVAGVALSAACSPSSSGSSSQPDASNAPSCTIADGNYVFSYSGSNADFCVSGEPVEKSWPPSLTDGGAYACDTTTLDDGSCSAVCTSPGQPTQTYAYSVSNDGLAGTQTGGEGAGPDGHGCTSTFSAEGPLDGG